MFLIFSKILIYNWQKIKIKQQNLKKSKNREHIQLWGIDSKIVGNYFNRIRKDILFKKK